VLIVLHQETSTPAGSAMRCGRWGLALDIRRPRFGDPLPASLDDHAGAVIFGGPMSANDPDAYLRAEIDWIASPLRGAAAYISASASGRRCSPGISAPPSPRTHEGRTQIGYYPIRPTDAGRALCVRGRTTSITASRRLHPAPWQRVAGRGQRFSVQAFRDDTPSHCNSIPTSPTR